MAESFRHECVDSNPFCFEVLLCLFNGFACWGAGFIVIASKDDLFDFASVIFQIMDSSDADDGPFHIRHFEAEGGLEAFGEEDAGRLRVMLDRDESPFLMSVMDFRELVALNGGPRAGLIELRQLDALEYPFSIACEGGEGIVFQYFALTLVGKCGAFGEEAGESPEALGCS